MSQKNSKDKTATLRRPISAGDRWLFALKIFTYLLIVASVFMTPGTPPALWYLTLGYSALTLYVPLSTLWKRLRAPAPVDRAILALQLTFEMIVALAVVALTGGSVSPFSGLLYLTIISGALTFGLINALALASLAMVGSAFAAWSGYWPVDVQDGFWEAVKEAPDDAFFTEFLRALTFYLTAFVAGYFSERLSSRDKQLEDTSRELSRARSQTDEIIKRLTTGLMTVDQAGNIVLFNDAAQNILDMPESTAQGQNFRDVFIERLGELGRELQLALESGAARPRREIHIRRKDNTEIPLGISVAATGDSEQRGVIAIFQDISEVKVMEEKARRSDRLMAVAELSASIAHEIRNPLAAIAGSAQMLSAELDLNDEESRLFELILKESSRLNRMLTDFLNYTRVGETPMSRVELCHLALESLEMMRQHPSYDESVALTFDSAEPVVYALGEEGQIKQIVFNLLLNSFEALVGNWTGERSISLQIEHPADSGPCLTISDTGPGIKESSADKIFSPFFSTKPNGSGLGLAIAHRLAEQMQINLELTPRAGYGASFSLHFTELAGLPRLPENAQV